MFIQELRRLHYLTRVICEPSNCIPSDLPTSNWDNSAKSTIMLYLPIIPLGGGGRDKKPGCTNPGDAIPTTIPKIIAVRDWCAVIARRFFWSYRDLIDWICVNGRLVDGVFANPQLMEKLLKRGTAIDGSVFLTFDRITASTFGRSRRITKAQVFLRRKKIPTGKASLA